jgi:hypothetical protein
MRHWKDATKPKGTPQFLLYAADDNLFSENINRNLETLLADRIEREYNT